MQYRYNQFMLMHTQAEQAAYSQSIASASPALIDGSTSAVEMPLSVRLRSEARGQALFLQSHGAHLTPAQV